MPRSTTLASKSFKEILLPCWSVVVSPTNWWADYQFIWGTKEFTDPYFQKLQKDMETFTGDNKKLMQEHK